MERYVASTRCPVCKAGLICWVFTAEHLPLVLMCDECHSVWKTPEGIGSTDPLSFTGEVQPFDGIDTSGVRWATSKEITKAGLMATVIGHE